MPRRFSPGGLPLHTLKMVGAALWAVWLEGGVCSEGRCGPDAARLGFDVCLGVLQLRIYWFSRPGQELHARS